MNAFQTSPAHSTLPPEQSADAPPAISVDARPTLVPLIAGLLALATLLGAAVAFSEPGYMDAYYYYHVAANLATGRGFTEDIIWNYLTNPAALTHPSNLYWMPLVSILAFPPMLVFGDTFRAAQAPFLLLSVATIVVTAVLAGRLLSSTFRPLAAALLTLCSGYYFVYWLAVDAFGAFTLAAMLAFVATGALLDEEPRTSRRTLLLGALIGVGTAIAHLARADGPLLFVACALALAIHSRKQPRVVVRPLFAATVAYLVVMLPWFVRNIAVSGSALPSGGLQTVFLREYNDIFSYGLTLDPAWYFAQSWSEIIAGKAQAALRNLGVLFGLQYWLVPFAAIGWWSMRDRKVLAAPLIYGVLLYLAMTLLFTFPSGRGAMLHSSIALLPWLSIAAIKGIEVAVYWVAARLPHWKPALATRNFTLLALLAAIVVSTYATLDQARQWNKQASAYRELAPVVFADNPSAVPMLLNAPGWWYATGKPAMQTPSNGPDAALAAAQRYGGTHLILEPATPKAWEGFDESANPRFTLVHSANAYRVYRIR